MSLQEKVIQEFKQTYPDLKLKEISRLTGIELTRVFRIFNKNWDLKLNEYEKIKKTITGHSEFIQFEQTSEIISLLEILPEIEKSKIINNLKYLKEVYLIQNGELAA